MYLTEYSLTTSFCFVVIQHVANSTTSGLNVGAMTCSPLLVPDDSGAGDCEARKIRRFVGWKDQRSIIRWVHLISGRIYNVSASYSFLFLPPSSSSPSLSEFYFAVVNLVSTYLNSANAGE